MLQEHLAELARIGDSGHPPFSPESKDDLLAALRELGGHVIGCSVALGSSVQLDDQCHGLVELNGVQLPCQDPDGWQLRDERTLQLSGQACADFTRKDATLHVRFPCSLVPRE